MRHVFREACRANLEFQQETGETRTEARDAILSTKLNEMIEEASCDWDRTRNIVGAALLAQPPNVYRQKLDAALEHEVANFTRQLFAMPDTNTKSLARFAPASVTVPL